jgi:mono/diheme cytochrome c family protein
MWGGIFLAAACWLCWLLRARTGENAPGIAYAIALGFSIGLVAWTGYRGAQLSLGENHLTEHMPAGLRQALGVSNDESASSKVDLNTFYGARIHPIFAARCVSCHGQGKHKADLRLDSYAALMRGGKGGPAVRAGNIQGSDLLRRISLPPEHDDFMPKGKQRLSPDQVKLIELWIGAGASATLAPDAIPDAIKAALAGSAAPVAREVIFETIDPRAVEQLRAGIAPAVAQLQKRFPNILDYESRGSADLDVNASILGPKFGDDDMAALTSIADHITTADFSRTAITDRSAPALAAMKRLHVLRLMNTAITDATTDKLSALDQLDSLNLFGTRVTAASLPAAAKLPRLAHLYAGQTAIPAETPVPQALAGKVVF